MKTCLSKILVVMAGLALVLAVTTNTHAQEIKIGALYPLSGPMALLGTHNMNGIELATDFINEQGGIKGKKIQLIKADIPTPEAARSEAERLINVEHLDVLFGSYSSSLSYVASSVAEKNKRIYWETGAIADNITQRNFKYLFRTISKASDSGYAAVDFMTQVLANDLGIKVKDLKVCVMHEDSLYGTSVSDGIMKRLKENGITPLAKESYSKTVTDLSPLILKFKSLKPDVILATCYINDAILWQRQMRELNFNIKALIGTGAGHALKDFAKAVGNDSDGVFDGNATFVKNPKSLDPKLDPPLQTVFDRYKKKFKEEPDVHVMTAFTGAWVFYKYVLSKAGSTNPEAIRKAAYEVDIPLGGTHLGWGMKFQRENDPQPGQNTRAFAVVHQWQGGEYYVVWPKQYAEKKTILVPLPNWRDRK